MASLGHVLSKLQKLSNDDVPGQHKSFTVVDVSLLHFFGSFAMLLCGHWRPYINSTENLQGVVWLAFPPRLTMKLASLQRRLLRGARLTQPSILKVVEKSFAIPSARIISVSSRASGSPGEDEVLKCAGSRSVDLSVLTSAAAAPNEWYSWFEKALGNNKRTTSCTPLNRDWQFKSSTLVPRAFCERVKRFSSLPSQTAEQDAEEEGDRSSTQIDDRVLEERGLAEAPADAVESSERIDDESENSREASASHILTDEHDLQEVQPDDRELNLLAPEPEAQHLEKGSLDGKAQELDSPAEKRQEKDRDPEREYFHVFKLEEIKRILEEVKGRDVEVMYVREKCNFTDYMVVVTGRTERHIRAMAEAVVRELSSRCQEIMEGLTPAVEGDPGQKWLLVDAGNIIVHFFTEEEREHYNLEGLWGGKAPTKRKYGPYGEVLD